jgi:hypothetical protein
MLPADPSGAQRRRRGEALAAALTCAAVAIALVALPDGWRLVAVPVAFAAGTIIERYRQGRRTEHLSLAETPRAWRQALTALRWRYVFAALAATIAAAGLLSLPELSPNRIRHQRDEADPGAGRAGPPALPHIKTIAGRPGRTVRAHGASFTVFHPTAEPWARSIRAQRAADRHTWVVVGVDGRNIHRRRFNPNAFAYRLRDGRRNLYAPVVGGGTGPASLARTGSLRPGESAQARLAFLVPTTAGHLTLVFEPGRDGSLQIQVPLGSRR